MIGTGANLVKRTEQVAGLVIEIAHLPLLGGGDESSHSKGSVKITGEFRALMCKRDRIVAQMHGERNVVTNRMRDLRRAAPRPAA